MPQEDDVTISPEVLARARAMDAAEKAEERAGATQRKIRALMDREHALVAERRRLERSDRDPGSVVGELVRVRARLAALRAERAAAAQLAHKVGLSAYQLQRTLGVTKPTMSKILSEPVE